MDLRWSSVQTMDLKQCSLIAKPLAVKMTIVRFMVSVTLLRYASQGFFVIQPTRRNNFTNLFCHETLHISDSSSVPHQEFVHCTLSNGIYQTAFEQDQVVPSWSCSKAVYKPVWHIPLLSVQWINSWWWTEELSETCRVSLQHKFVKLVHLFGFIIKKFVTMTVTCHDARSHVTMHGHMNVKCPTGCYQIEEDVPF